MTKRLLQELLFLAVLTLSAACAVPPPVERVPSEPMAEQFTPIASQATETPLPTLFSEATRLPITPSATPTVVGSKTPTASRTERAPTLTPETEEDTIFGTILAQIAVVAEGRRVAERAKSPGDYDQQVDPELAKIGTIFLLYICGIDHQPPVTEKVRICANSLFVLHSQIDRLIFTHDTRFPEEEIEEGVLGQPNSARRSDQLWLGKKGGFHVMRQGWQNATGLPIDFIFVVQDDVAIKELVDKCFGRLRVMVPIAFTAQPIYLDEKTKIGPRYYPAGEEEMNGLAVLQYIKAVPKADSYPPELENHERIKVVLQAMSDEVERQKFNPLFWPPFLFHLTSFMTDQIKSQNFVTDFDAKALMVDSIGDATEEIKRQILSGRPIKLGIPTLGKSRYYLDPSAAVYKNQPIHWGDPGSGDPFVIEDVRNKVYEPFFVAVPWNGNPYTGHLPTDYWFPVRADVKTFFSKDKSP